MKMHDAGCSNVRKALKNGFPEFFEDEIKYFSDKIYAFKHATKCIHVLTEIPEGDDRGKCYFTELNTTDMYAGYISSSAQELIDSRKEDIKVFDNQKEFFSWALKNS